MFICMANIFKEKKKTKCLHSKRTKRKETILCNTNKTIDLKKNENQTILCFLRKKYIYSV
jgi:hypothetical protein